MASLYKRKPYWWIKWNNPETEEIERFSTKLLIGIGSEWAQAKTLCAKYSAREVKSGGSRATQSQAWETWVEDFIVTRYTDATQAPGNSTVSRFLGCWRRLSQFLFEQKLNTPREVRRKHCFEYLKWRRLGDKATGRKPVGQNTILEEIVVLALVMKEAVKREMAEVNPCIKLDIKRQAPKVKKEITTEEMALIRRELENADNFKYTVGPKFQTNWQHLFKVSFEIGMLQGCRLSETYIDLEKDVDWVQKRVTFHCKGGKLNSVPINPDLLPLLEQLRAEGRRTTYDRPKFQRSISIAWCQFLKQIGLPHLSFHCTRVTFISICHRAGVPAENVMKMVNHSSTEVHRIYRRVLNRELDQHWGSLKGLSGSSPAVCKNNSESLDDQPAISARLAPLSLVHG